MADATQEKQVETVKMEDGRQVDFAGKKQILKSYGTNGSGTVYGRFDFRNGKSLEIVLPPELVQQAAGHGLVQKGGDSAAGAKDLDDAFEAISQVKENIEKGDWNARVEGSGFSGISVLAKALVEHYASSATPKSIEQVRAFLKTKTPADKIALRNSKKLRPIVERIEAEKATKGSKVDAEALLAELG
jgi:hypothetical protein